MENKYLVLEANAGSGKTFSLVSRYLNLLFLGVPPKKIFALTFAKKATKEMFDRVLHSLQNPHTSGEILEIAKKMNLSDIEIELQTEKYLTEFINSDVKITTLDSLEHLILKKFAHYLNIVPNYKVINEIDIERFQSLFLENISKTKYKHNLLKLESLDKRLKPSSILNELNNIYKKQIQLNKFQEHYLKIETEDKLAELELFTLEITDKISEWLLQPEFKLSKSAKSSLNFKNIEELLKKGTTWLAKDNLENYSLFKKAFKNTSSESTAKINLEFQKLKYSLTRYFDMKIEMIFKNLFELFQFYVRERETFIKKEHKFSFDDINHFLVKLIINDKIDSQFIYFRLDSNIDHLLIDEFQDTSLLQYKVLEPIISDILSGGSQEHKTFFYVGDKMQSLYRFRGGFSDLFDHLQIQFPTLKHKTLPNNYRSKENIVNFVNQMFGTNQKIGNANQKGGNVILKEFPNPVENAVDEVLELIQNGINLNEIAIISSKNSEISQISKELVAREIKVKVETTQSIIEYLPVQSATQYILYLYYAKHKNSSFYLKNFQASIGKNPKNICKDIIDLDISTLSLFEIGVKIFQHFKLFNGDENSLKFLESLETDYLDITDFVHNYQRESLKISQTKTDGINLLTIHKAKGLEFEYVIFVDFSSTSYGNNKNSKLIQSFDKIEVENISWNLGNSFNLNIAKIIDAEQKANQQDTINKLYVALTRAKTSLIMLKKVQKSALDLLDISKFDFSKQTSH